MFVSKDGREIPVEGNANGQFKDGAFVARRGIFRDVTERRQAEAALQQERDRIQQYLDLAGVMFVVLDQQANITLINQKGCEILGYQEDELLDRNWFDTCVPARYDAAVLEALKMREANVVQLRSSLGGDLFLSIQEMVGQCV